MIAFTSFAVQPALDWLKRGLICASSGDAAGAATGETFAARVNNQTTIEAVTLFIYLLRCLISSSRTEQTRISKLNQFPLVTARPFQTPAEQNQPSSGHHRPALETEAQSKSKTDPRRRCP